MRREEQFAKAVVEELRPELTLEFNRSQSNGEPDFQILDSSGNTLGVLEVTILCDATRVEQVHLLFGQKKLSKVPRALCSRSWIVTVADGVHVKPLRAQLDSLLKEAEELGLKSLTPDDERSSNLYSRLRSLSGNGRADTHDESDYHRLAPQAYAFFRSESSVNEVLSELLRRTDNMKKLTSNGLLPERHLFVGVDLSSRQACDQLMRADALPVSHLPDEVTDLWLVPSHIATDSTLAVWHMRNGSGWERLSLANGFIPKRRTSA